MLFRTIFAGFGGQGILMMGYALSFTTMKKGKYVTFLPSYGAEMRGGTANCTVVISSQEIASPIASAPEAIVIMNTPSLVKFQNRVKSGGTFFVNSSQVQKKIFRKDVEVCKVPVAEMAEKLGNIRVANMVMLGAFLKKTKLLPLDALSEELINILPQRHHRLIDLNKKALNLGFEYEV